MSNILVYSVFDSKISAHLQPMFCLTEGQAIRSFSDAVMDDKTSLFLHPHDYSLFQIGEFDQHSGMLFPLTAPIQIITGSEVRHSALRSRLPVSHSDDTADIHSKSEETSEAALEDSTSSNDIDS